MNASTITKLPPAPAIDPDEPPTAQTASRDAVNAILDGALARQIAEIDGAIEQLQQVKSEMLRDHVTAKSIVGRHFDIIERLHEHSDDGRRALERMRADRAALINAR